jgi:hypothetical protein
MAGTGKAVGLAVAAASIAGVVLWKRSRRRKERADLYFADGSMVSFEQGSLEAGRLLPTAQEILAAARGRV